MTCALRDKAYEYWQKSVGLFCLSVLFFILLLPCWSETETGACTSVIFYKKYILIHLCECRFFENPVKLVYVLSLSDINGFNHAFLIVWSSDLSCQFSCIYGTCIALLKYPSSYSSSLLQSEVHTSAVAGRFSAVYVLGRVPLCIRLISNDCIFLIASLPSSMVP